MQPRGGGDLEAPRGSAHTSTRSQAGQDSYDRRDRCLLYVAVRVRRFEAVRRRLNDACKSSTVPPVWETLAGLPSNRLEALHGDRQGQHSIRINDQWRVCFVWRMLHTTWRLWIITEGKRERGCPTRCGLFIPGEVLKGEMEELGLSARQLAMALGVPTNRVTAIVHETRA